jgi:cell division protease FtsH
MKNLKQYLLPAILILLGILDQSTDLLMQLMTELNAPAYAPTLFRILVITLGAIKLGIADSQPFLGRDYGHQRDYSENVAAIVDTEIRLMIENAHQEAFDVLVANRDVLDELVNELLEKETLNKEEIEKVFKKVKKVRKRAAWTGSKLRVPSTIPPVALKPAKVKEKPVEKAVDKVVEKPAKKTAAKKPANNE